MITDRYLEGSRRRPGFPALVGSSLLVAGLLVCAPAQGGPLPPAQKAAGEPLAGLTQDQLDRFFLGQQQFDKDFTEEEGLGPIFNATSCGACHITPLGGTGTIKVLRAGQVTKAGFDPLEDFGGSLFQLEEIDPACAEDPPPKANVFTDRTTNGMMGYGLVEAIPDADLIFYQDNPPSAFVSGEAHMVEAFEDPGVPRVGRFGWKAQVPTILTFSADAGLQEIGITTRFLTMDNDPNGIFPPELVDCDNVADPEDNLGFGNGVDKEFIDVVTDFQRFLTQPPQTPKSGMAGETIFNTIGCADCHIASFTTADDPKLEDAIRNKVIRPYGDFLLHDMGPPNKVGTGGGDGIVQGDAGAQEIKTAPLAGLRMRTELWHDGRFADPTRVRDSIVAHDEGFGLSEAAFSADNFLALSAGEQDQLLAFLDSLGRREFDQNDDNAVTILDFHGFGAADAFKACFGGTPGPDDDCAIHDVDQNANVDLNIDFMVFLTVYEGPMGDCNDNGTLDLIDILEGTSLDDDDNGIPDECEPTCPGDTNGSGDVGINDFLNLLADWGDCPALPDPCPSDLDFDGTVGIDDFLLLLTLWGVCP